MTEVVGVPSAVAWLAGPHPVAVFESVEARSEHSLWWKLGSYSVGEYQANFATNSNFWGHGAVMASAGFMGEGSMDLTLLTETLCPDSTPRKLSYFPCKVSFPIHPFQQICLKY